MIYTEEQFNILSKATPHFESVRRDYIRNAPKWLTEQIMDVYEAATKKHLIYKDVNCAVCVMNIYKIIGKTYYSDLEERKKLINETSFSPSETSMKQLKVTTKQNETSRKKSETNKKHSDKSKNKSKTKK